jgi:hypothetical protein
MFSYLASVRSGTSKITVYSDVFMYLLCGKGIFLRSEYVVEDDSALLSAYCFDLYLVYFYHDLGSGQNVSIT